MQLLRNKFRMRELLKYSLYVYFSTLFIFQMLSDVDRILLEYTINLEFKLTSVKTGFVPKNWIAFQQLIALLVAFRIILLLKLKLLHSKYNISFAKL